MVKSYNILSKILTVCLTAATTLALAYTLFGVGFTVCTTPQATQAVGSVFSGWNHSTYPEDEMAMIAEGVRAYSIDGQSTAALLDTIDHAMTVSYPELEKILQAGSFEDTGLDTSDLRMFGVSTLSDLVSRYSMPQNALSHLQDCVPIFTTGRISVGVIGFGAVVGLVALAVLRGRRTVGRVMMAGSALVLATLLFLGGWAIFDFDSLFTSMHNVLFAQGNWIFDANSLLIQLFPEGFWAAMAGLWVLTSVGLSLVVMLVGRIIRGK